MKRKFTGNETRVVRNGLWVRVQVNEVGPAWFFEIKVPFWAIDLEAFARESADEAERIRKMNRDDAHQPELPFD